MSSDLNSPPPIDLRRRVFALDVLRGIAILMVLPAHSMIPDGSIGWLQPVRDFVGGFGGTGVDLFFVLSGFLIGGLLFREIQETGTLNGRRFLVRRALKLWPGYFALVAWAFLKAWRHHIAVFQQLWPQLLQVQNYMPSLRPHTWSLAVEEHFYIVLTAIVSFIAVRRPKLIAAHFDAIAVLIIGCTALWRSIQPLLVPFSIASLYLPTHVRLDTLLFGVLLAHVAAFRPKLWQRLLQHPSILLLLGICLILPRIMIIREPYWSYTAGYTLLTIALGAILVGSLGLQRQFATSGTRSKRPAIGARLLAPIAWIGFFSYGIYLWHIDFAQQPVWFRVLPRLHFLSSPSRWLVAMVIYVLVAIAAGTLMTYVIEIPMLKFRERFFPRAGRSSPRLPDVALQPLETASLAGASI